MNRVIFRSMISKVVAFALLASAAVVGPSPAFAKRRDAEACRAAFMNKCLADCNRRAGRQCDWFCGRRSSGLTGRHVPQITWPARGRREPIH